LKSPSRSGLFSLVATVAAFVSAVPSAFAASLTWDTTNASDAIVTDGAGTWSNQGITWNNGSASVAWSNATPDSATFSGTAGGTVAITLGTNVTQNGTIFNGSSNYTFSGGFVITGLGGVTMNGTGTVTLGAGMVSYGGPTTVNAGTLVLTSGSGANSYSAGNLFINGASTLRFVGQRYDFSGKTFTFDAIGGGTLDILVGGQGSLVSTTGNSIATKGGARDTVSGSGTNQGINLNGALTFDVASGTDATTDLTVSATLFNGGSVVKTSAGRMTLSGPNTYTGGTTITGGTITFANGSIGPSGTVSMNGGTLQWSGSNTQDVSNRIGMVSAKTATFDTNGNNVIFANSIGGNSSAALTKTGAGTLTLSATPSYKDITTISAGSLEIAGPISSFPSAGIVNNATMRFATTGGASGVMSYANAIGGTGVFNIDTTGSNGARLQLSGTALNNTNTWNVINEGALWFTGSGSAGSGMNVTIAAGTGPGAYLKLNGSSGAVFNIGTLSGAGKITNDSGNSQTLVVGNGNGSSTFSGAMSGASSLTKAGTGLFTLSGNNTYTGATVISGGTLRLAGNANLPPGLKIMPLGDSITYGAYGTNGGYRGPLYSLLAPAATGFQFVGDSTVNPGNLPAGEQNHAGHSSYSTLDINHNLDGFDNATFVQYGDVSRDPNGGYWLTGISGTRDPLYPDVILLLVGANDIGRLNAVVQQNIDDLVAKITTLRPNAKLIVADITPYIGRGSDVTAWNGYVNAVVSKYAGLGKSVTRVDLNTGFPANGLSADGVHPNDTGYTWMASQWNNAILALYPATSGYAGGIPSNSPTTVASDATLDLNGNSTTVGPLSGSGQITLGSTGSLTVNSTSGNNSTFSGIISGAGGFTKSGPATLVLSGVNTYSGSTIVSSGTLTLSQAFLSDTSSVNIAPGAVLNLTHGTSDTIAALTLGGVVQAPGVYNAINHPTYFSGSGSLVIPTGYAAWISQHYPGSVDPALVGVNANPSGDGIPNLLKYVLGGDPRMANTSILPGQTTVGSNLLLTYSRNDNSTADTTQTGQWSTDLIIWHDITPTMVSDNGASPDTMSIAIPLSNAADGRLFGRLHVTQP